MASNILGTTDHLFAKKFVWFGAKKWLVLGKKMFFVKRSDPKWFQCGKKIRNRYENELNARP